MIVDKTTLTKIKDFGLNTYESKVWVALLSRGISTAGELSDIANVPRSRSYDVLESLEKKGFVVMKIGKPIKYIAVPPEEAIERVKKRIKKEAEAQENMINELKESKLIDELVSLHNKGIETHDPSDITGSIKGRNNIYNHLQYQIKNAKNNVVLATTEDGLIRKSEYLLRYMKKAKERGVEIKIAAPLTEKSKDVVKLFSQYAEVKNVDKVHSRFCIIDGHKTTVMLTDDEKVHPSYDLAVWMHTQKLADTLQDTI